MKWELRHWKDRQLDLFLWNEVPDFTVEIPVVNERGDLSNFHSIVMANPMIPREVIDNMAKEIADKIDEEIYREYTAGRAWRYGGGTIWAK